jgi:hypothetical protein
LPPDLNLRGSKKPRFGGAFYLADAQTKRRDADARYLQFSLPPTNSGALPALGRRQTHRIESMREAAIAEGIREAEIGNPPRLTNSGGARRGDGASGDASPNACGANPSGGDDASPNDGDPSRDGDRDPSALLRA